MCSPVSYRDLQNLKFNVYIASNQSFRKIQLGARRHQALDLKLLHAIRLQSQNSEIQEATRIMTGPHIFIFIIRMVIESEIRIRHSRGDSTTPHTYSYSNYTYVCGECVSLSRIPDWTSAWKTRAGARAEQKGFFR